LKLVYIGGEGIRRENGDSNVYCSVQCGHPRTKHASMDRSVEMNLVDTINFLHVYREVDGGSITPFKGGPHTLTLG
jgi:hypothetical protein